MKKEPVDYNNPLGISKKEWVRVLTVNLALLLIVYAVALIVTLCGSDFFLLQARSECLQTIEDTLRGWGIYQLIKIGFATVEETIILWFVTLKRPKWWWPVSYFAIRVANNLLFTYTIGGVPGASVFVINFGFCIVFALTFKKKCLKPLIRFVIALAVSLLLNEGIGFLRTKLLGLNHLYTNIEFFYLSLEYDLALLLSLGLLAIAIPWNETKGDQQPWAKTGVVGGSSPTSMKKSRTNSPTKNNGLTDKQRKRIRKLKAKMFIVQSVALAFICFVPVLLGKPTEFALM